MIHLKKNITFLYVFLFAGAFNDIIRINSTQISLFRVMLPIALTITLLCGKRSRKPYLMFVIFAIISAMQSVIFEEINDLGINFNIQRYFTYLFYYICNVAVIATVIMLHEKEGDCFCDVMERLITLIAVMYLVIFISLYLLGEDMREYLNVNNQNDYGAMISMVIPFFYFKCKKYTIKYILFIPIAVLFLVLNDCKLALLGTVLQAILIVYFECGNKIANSRKVLLIPALLLLFVLLVFLNSKNVSLNGYDWKDTVMNPIKSIIHGKIYEYSNTSATYRANVFVVSIQWMLKTWMIGIGIGNSGVLVRKVLGEYSLYENWMSNDAVSLHNAFLEIGLEFGIIAVIGLLLVVNMIISLLHKKKMTDYEQCFVITVVSSILWLQGPSGILVDYFIITFFAYLAITIKDVKIKEGIT